MDYLSRLVGNASPSPTRQSSPYRSQQRLIQFKKAHDQLQQVWRRNGSGKQLLPAVSVGACLDSIVKTLQDETQTPVPHLCARHVSTFQSYKLVVQVVFVYHDEFVIHQAFDIFKVLIDSEEVDFLESTIFADAFIGFIGKISTTGPLTLSADTEVKLVEVMFATASKIRLQPQLLSIWFRPVKSNEQVAENAYKQAGSEFNTRTEKDVFPLFYLILDYVHHDGKVGDFARTGLLYLIETAAQSEALEKWIVEGDLATLMASGLGALYSQLSRKLVLSFARDSMPAVVSFSEAVRPLVPRDAEEAHSLDFQSHLSTFLSYLVFWQDVLEHCSSLDVKESLLDHFKLLFLQQLLYPSLIESSDVDGGSSVAVLTYLRCIIESIDHVDLLRITLEYLLALPEKREEDAAPVRPTTLARRRKSSVLVMTLSQGQEKPIPDLFTLVDLVITSLRSHDQQTLTATLQLVSGILRSHHNYALSSLVRTVTCADSVSIRSIDAQTIHTTTLFSMAEGLIEHDELRDMHDAHLQDARTLLEDHCCSLQLLALPGSRASETRLKNTHNNKVFQSVRSHLLDVEDPLLCSLMSLLGEFLANDVATNLSLTRVFSTLASCGYTSLNGWLLGDTQPSEAPSIPSRALDDSCEREDAIKVDRGSHDPTSEAVLESSQSINPGRTSIGHGTSPIFATLESLVDQVERYRHDIEDFDMYLAERRHIFKIDESIEQAVANDVPAVPKSEEQDSGESAGGPKSRKRALAQLGSIPERLMSETSSLDVSRSSSPRGRQLGDPNSNAFRGRLNHLRISPSPTLSDSDSRTFSPSPLRKGSQTSASPKPSGTPIGPPGALRRKIKVKVRSDLGLSRGQNIGSETSSIRSSSTTADVKTSEPDDIKEISLSHLLTNIIILQEFMMELAAIIEVRASLFGEVSLV